MRLVPQFLKNAVVPLILGGVAYAIFFYVAHFTQIQGVVLACIAVVVIDCCRMASKAATKQGSKFEPYWVSVEPNWSSICHDFGLAAGDNWTEIQEKCKVAPAGYSILRNGLNFTMLSQTLFYSNDHQTFFGKLDFNMPMF